MDATSPPKISGMTPETEQIVTGLLIAFLVVLSSMIVLTVLLWWFGKISLTIVFV